MPESSIDRWLTEVRAGGADAQQLIWDEFFPDLVALARKRLAGARRTVQDEEDVALSVLQSFFSAIQKKQFPDMRGRDSLWRLLSWMTQRKAIDRIRFQSRQKRNVQGESAMWIGDARDLDDRPMEKVVGREIEPDIEAILIEELHVLMSLLNEPMKLVAVAKMEGFSNAEIAQQQSCSIATVERRLKMIREIWTQHGKSSQLQSSPTTSDPS